MTQPSLAGLEGAAPAAQAEVRLIRDEAALAVALPALVAADVIGLDTETTGLDFLGDRLRLVQLAVPGAVFVVDCFAVDARALQPVFDGGARFLGHNLGFDLRFLLANGVRIPDGDRLFDTMLASQLLQSGKPEPRGTHSLAGVAERMLGIGVDKTEQRSDWSGSLSDSQIAYAAKDAAVLLPLAEKLDAELHRAGLSRAAAIEMRALPAIAWMEHTGAPFDQQAWRALSDAAVAEQRRLEQELTAMSGTADMFGDNSVNWGSPDQVQKLLSRRGHPVRRTDEFVLQGLVEVEPLALLLLQHRDASRKASSYGGDFLRHVHANTGRIHADYAQIGASSGRMACGSPNLQNIPREAAYRACFRPAPGRALVKADYSQIELRIVAQVSRDPVLLAAYAEGADVHLRTAASVMSVPEAQVTKTQRQLAKALNFGLLYGMGAPRLKDYAAGTYGVQLTDEQAQTFRERFFQTYPGLRRWHRLQSDQPVNTRTLAGRRRLGVDRFVDKLNLPIQGAGADILKLALARLWEDRVTQPSAVPVLCVHDEIVVECDAAAASAVAPWLTGHMEAAGAELLPDVPVVADVTIAADWSGAPLFAEA
ncbi:MAG: DNA polymerase [Dehalococcoidia bacterium]